LDELIRICKYIFFVGNDAWKEVEFRWQECPKQADNDCAIFVIRMIDCLARNVDMDFDQINLVINISCFEG
jgi:Ulp1 family protease